MKTANALVGFVRRLQLSDLMLPAGAALVTAGLQKLVDRETLQRRRLAALAELVDDHRQTLEANGVELPADRFGDEMHPLDIDGALELILLRAPSEPAPVEVKPGKRRAVRGTVIGLLAAGIVLSFPAGRKILRDGAVALADGVRPFPWGPTEADPESTMVATYRASSEVPAYGSGPAEPPLEHPEVELELDGPPSVREPLETCGWDGCDWVSQAHRSSMSQGTAAAVHRNRCTHRPANAQVDG